MTGLIALVRYVAVRHLWGAKLRSALTVFGVALGVAMLVGTSAANEAILHAFDELADRAAGKADLEIVADESGVDQALVDELTDRRDLAAHVAGRLEHTTLRVETGARILVLGADLLGDLEFLPFKTKGGSNAFFDPLAFVNDPHAVLVTESLGLPIGGELSLRTAHGVEKFHVEAVLAETGASRAFGGQVVVMSLDAAQLAFMREGKVDRIDVALPPGASVDEGARALGRLVGTRGAVDRPSKRAASFARMTAAFQGGLSVTAIVSLLVGTFLVYNTIGIAVSQRRREIGILRALGATRRAVVGVFLGEALLLGLLGGALGVFLGAGLAKGVVGQFAPNVSRFFENIATPAVKVGPRLMAQGVAVGVLASLFAAYFPARRAASVPPVESVRVSANVASTARRRRGPLAALGALLLVAAAVVVRLPNGGLPALLAIFFAAMAFAPAAVALVADHLGPAAQALFGVAARLGVEGAGRSLGQSAQTVSALTLATALGLTLSSYTHSYSKACFAWVEQAIPADVVVSAGSPLLDRYAIPFDPSVKAAVEKVDGVQATNLVRAISVPTHGVRAEVVSVETTTYLARLGEARQVVAGPRRVPPMHEEPMVLISENFAWRTRLKPGDSVELPSPTGRHTFRILAVVVDYSNDQGWMLIDRRWALEYWKDPRVEMIHVYLKPGVDPVAAAARIREAIAGGPGMFVTTNAEMKSEIRKVIEQTFGIAGAAETIALIVAVLGVVGTMIATVIDRRRELGMLRAIGATRRQVAFAVAVEAATLGAVAAVLAALASIPCSKIFVDVVAFQASGWSVPLGIPVLAYLRVSLLLVSLSALAGLFPGLRAARETVTRQ